LCKSIEFASVPVDSSEHSFNIRRIPILVHECTQFIKNYISTKGIFRVSGNEKRIADLIAEFDSPPSYGLGCSFTGKSVHDVASFLKKFLRSLPEPLFSTDLYSHFLNAMNLPAEDGSRIYALRLLLYLLPPTHLILLEYLLVLFHDVQSNSAENQMTAHNIGLIFAPTLLRTKTKTPIEEYDKLAKLIEYMILNHQQFIITHPERDPEKCLDLVFLPQLKEIYNSKDLNLGLAKRNTLTATALMDSPLILQQLNSPVAFESPIIDMKREESVKVNTLNYETPVNASALHTALHTALDLGPKDDEPESPTALYIFPTDDHEIQSVEYGSNAPTNTSTLDRPISSLPRQSDSLSRPIEIRTHKPSNPIAIPKISTESPVHPRSIH
jgi:hypothetical protein